MTEFENRNSNRSYPFSSDAPTDSSDGIPLPSDVFVDAIVYPPHEVEWVCLSSLDFSSGRVVLSDSSGSEYEGTESGGTVELFLNGRRVGTVLCGHGMERERFAGRRMRFVAGDVRLSAACVVPVVLGCVTSISSGGGTVYGGIVGVEGAGRLTSSIVAEAGPSGPENVLRFDVRAKRRSKEDFGDDSSPVLRTLAVFVLPGSVLDADRENSSSALLSAGNLDRDDVCYHAHLEDQASMVYDTCSENVPIECVVPVSQKEMKSFELSGCSVYLHSYDLLNYRNPVKVETVQGEFAMNSPKIGSGSSESEADEEVQKLAYSQIGSGNGVRIEIPGSEAT